MRNFHATAIEGLLFLCPSSSVLVIAVVNIANLASNFVARLHPIYGAFRLGPYWLQNVFGFLERCGWSIGWLVCSFPKVEKIMIFS